MAELQSPPADEKSPDHATCVHCGKAISWDEVCYTHDSSGFADCGVTVNAHNRGIYQAVALKGMMATPTTWGAT